MKKFKYTLFFILFYTFLFSQPNNFHPPLGIPLVLTGSFGELRDNHFHAGIDLRTNGETGLQVFTIDEGFISRIGVSSGGYGKVIYIEHPNGLTSVYAHLESFTPRVEAWVKKQQYTQERFEVNLYPVPGQFFFTKGAEIALSGNSGSSGGPHLHFEIRETEGQYPVNPLTLNFNISDNTPPHTEYLYIYPLSDSSHIINKTHPHKIKLVKHKEVFRPSGTQTLEAFGQLGFGVDAIDYFDNNWSKCGIVKLEYMLNGELMYSFKIDRLNYSNMRYINSHIDYAELMNNKKRIHKAFKEPGNKLHIYNKSVNDGIYKFNEEISYKVQIVLYDFHQNKSMIEFFISATKPVKHPGKEHSNFFNFDRENQFSTSDFHIQIPKGALYNNVLFVYDTEKAPEGSYSALHKVHNNETPLHVAAEIEVKANNLPDYLSEKALLAFYNPEKNNYSYIGGEFENGTLKAKTRNFGAMCVIVDTIAPTITPLSIRNNRLTEPGRIRFRIKDDLSGIKSYEGRINGKWVLFEYDSKRDMLEYSIDEKVESGKLNKLTLKLVDRKNNSSEFNVEFYCP
jgi:hypothetical protein